MTEPYAVTDLMVLVAPDGRFAVLSREQLMTHIAPVSSVEDIPASMFQFMSTLTWLNEAEARLQLGQRGLSAAAVDDRIAGARRMLAVISSQPTVMERITRVGFRNADGQEVMGRTELRAGEQRVFVMRCNVCGHEYGSYGCDIDIRRCPKCQDGLPGLPT